MRSSNERTEELKEFDASEHLHSQEDCAAYLQEFLNDENEVLLLSAIGDVLKAQLKMTQVSHELGVSREGLIKALAGFNRIEFGTLIRIFKLLGLKLSVEPLSVDKQQG